MKRRFFIIHVFVFFQLFSQQIPKHFGYVSDNIYLLHTAAAGVGATGKIRFSTRKQWLHVKNAPSLHILTFHTRTAKKSAIGAVIFQDENGHFSTSGFKGTYAYHLPIGEGRRIFHQFSFAFSMGFYQRNIDKRDFTNESDPAVAAIRAMNNYNLDFGMAYHYKNFYSYLTIGNIFLLSDTKIRNQRNYFLYLGHCFGSKKLQYEPSVMLSYDESAKNIGLDVNMKIYKNILNTRFWFAFSYAKKNKNTYDLSPIFGIDYKDYVFSYIYTETFGNQNVINEGVHQITLGINVFKKKFRQTACPNINASFMNHY